MIRAPGAISTVAPLPTITAPVSVTWPCQVSLPLICPTLACVSDEPDDDEQPTSAQANASME